MGPQNALQRTLNVSKIYVILTWHSNDAIKLLIVNCFFFYLFYFLFFTLKFYWDTASPRRFRVFSSLFVFWFYNLFTRKFHDVLKREIADNIKSYCA